MVSSGLHYDSQTMILFMRMGYETSHHLDLISTKLELKSSYEAMHLEFTCLFAIESIL